jgi:hypothetical protein
MRFYEFIKEQLLSELAMTPKALDMLASKIDAIAGIEFEMYVPDISDGDNSDPEMVKDYDEDERVRSFDRVIHFFDDRDYNTASGIRKLEAAMREDYDNWVSSQVSEYWDTHKTDVIGNYLRDVVHVEDEDEIAQRLDAATTEKNSNSDYIEANNSYNEDPMRYMEDDITIDTWVHDEFDYMSGIERAYNIEWPHWIPLEDDSSGSIDSIADEFEKVISRKVNRETTYHAARRDGKSWIVEPDSSLDSPNSTEDMGLEFISPPLPVEEMLEDLETVRIWAKDYGCYTNESTGLHMNISIKNAARTEVDYVKLAILLGDNHIIEEFSREGNRYCAASINTVMSNVTNNPAQATALLDKMRVGLSHIASKAIHSGITDKYTSIHPQEGYIEFRAPGGDWLNANYDKLKNTMLRMVVALDASMDPVKYRKEYLTKLYKILAPKGEDDPIALFAKHATGQLSGPALKSFVKSYRAKQAAVNATKAPVYAQSRTPPVETPQTAQTPIEVQVSPNATPGMYQWNLLDNHQNVLTVIIGIGPNVGRARATQWLQRNTSSDERATQGPFTIEPAFSYAE